MPATDHQTARGTLAIPRSRGTVTGLVIVTLGIWGPPGRNSCSEAAPRIPVAGNPVAGEKRLL